MPRRGNKIRKGRHWVVNERTGIAFYDDDAIEDWDGVVTQRFDVDGEHPQFRVRALNDPYPVRLIRPEIADFDKTCGFYIQEYIPHTIIKRKLTQYEESNFDLPGIGQMAIGPPANDCGHLFVVGPSSIVVSYPLVEAINTSFGEPGISHIIRLPNGISSGRRVLVIAAAEGNMTGFTWPAGWTEIGSGNNTFNISISIAYIDIDGSEGFSGTDDTITVTTDAAQPTTHISYLMSNVQSSKAPELTINLTGDDDSPDPPNHDAVEGIQDYLVIAFEVHNTASIDTVDIPLEYSNQIESQSN